MILGLWNGKGSKITFLCLDVKILPIAPFFVLLMVDYKNDPSLPLSLYPHPLPCDLEALAIKKGFFLLAPVSEIIM